MCERLRFCYADQHYAQVRGELEYIAQNLEAESWSMAVDQNYLKSLNKEAIKRQDVIYGNVCVCGGSGGVGGCFLSISACFLEAAEGGGGSLTLTLLVFSRVHSDGDAPRADLEDPPPGLHVRAEALPADRGRQAGPALPQRGGAAQSPPALSQLPQSAAERSST